MDVAATRELLSDTGQHLLHELSESSALDDVVRLVTRLRAAGHSAELVSAVVEQAQLRRRAAPKFGPRAAELLFTPDGLEQATRAQVAARHAARYVAAGLTSVADLGSGIGADALAFADAGLAVLAVERDPATAALAAWNLRSFPSARVVTADVVDVELSGIDSLWLDPARRAGGRRQNDPSDWSPPLDWAFARAQERPTGIKLGPAIDHALLPHGCEAQWISVDRQVVEAVVWSGALARPGVGRAALMLGEHGAVEVTAHGPVPDVDTRPLGDYLIEPDGAIIRARLIGDLARSVGGGMIDPTIAWITTDTAPEVGGRGQTFRVRERFPLDAKVLKRELGPRYRSLEIKKRGIDIDPAEFRARLALRGTESGVLILTRAAGQRVALLAERVRG